MTVACPSGHLSVTRDYCDQCGAPMGGEPLPQQPTLEFEAVDEPDTSPAAVREPCPKCGAARSGDDRYCEGCGHDFLAPPVPRVAWEAVATADRGRFDRLAPEGVAFPSDYGERRFVLADGEIRIGRRRGRPGEAVPEIDLAEGPEDPGISRLHAVLERQADGTYALRDLGSTNGTTINDDPALIGSEVAVPLASGDRIRLGAWTTITIQAR